MAAFGDGPRSAGGSRAGPSCRRHRPRARGGRPARRRWGCAPGWSVFAVVGGVRRGSLLGGLRVGGGGRGGRRGRLGGEGHGGRSRCAVAGGARATGDGRGARRGLPGGRDARQGVPLDGLPGGRRRRLRARRRGWLRRPGGRLPRRGRRRCRRRHRRRRRRGGVVGGNVVVVGEVDGGAAGIGSGAAGGGAGRSATPGAGANCAVAANATPPVAPAASRTSATALAAISRDASDRRACGGRTKGACVVRAPANAARAAASPAISSARPGAAAAARSHVTGVSGAWPSSNASVVAPFSRVDRLRISPLPARSCALPLRVMLGEHPGQPLETAVGGDADRSRARAQHGAGGVRVEPDDGAQQHRLRLPLRQRRDERDGRAGGQAGQRVVGGVGRRGRLGDGAHVPDVADDVRPPRPHPGRVGRPVAADRADPPAEPVQVAVEAVQVAGDVQPRLRRHVLRFRPHQRRRVAEQPGLQVAVERDETPLRTCPRRSECRLEARVGFVPVTGVHARAHPPSSSRTGGRRGAHARGNRPPPSAPPSATALLGR